MYEQVPRHSQEKTYRKKGKAKKRDSKKDLNKKDLKEQIRTFCLHAYKICTIHRQTCIWVKMMLMQSCEGQVYLPSHLCHF